MGIRAAVSQILKIEEDWEALDVRQIDASEVIGRFRNLSDLSPASLATYESRFRSGLESYIAYLDNPTTYQPKARRQSAQRDPGRQAKPRGSGGRTGGESDRTAAEGPTIATASQLPPAGVRLVVYPFPVRPHVFAELKLPADLTADEAARLSGFLKAIALSDGSDQE